MPDRSRRHANILVASVFTSALGTYMTGVGIPLHIYRLSGNDKAVMGLASMVIFGTTFLGIPLGGWLAERFELRRLLLIGYVVGAIASLLLIFPTSHGWLIAGATLVACSNFLFRPVFSTMVPYLVGKEAVGGVNARAGAFGALADFMGPVAAAAIYDLTQGLELIIVIDVVSYVAAFGLALMLPAVVPEGSKREARRVFRDIADGFGYVLRRPELLVVLAAAYLNYACVEGFVKPLLMPLVNDVLAQPERAYGYLTGIHAVGAVLGGLFAARLMARFGSGRVFFTAFALPPVLALSLGSISSLWAALVVIFCWGVLNLLLAVSLITYLQLRVERGYLGRTMGVANLRASFPIALGSLALWAFGGTQSVGALLRWDAAVYLLLFLPLALLAARHLVRKPEEASAPIPSSDGAPPDARGNHVE